jgi:hypothetical protein
METPYNRYVATWFLCCGRILFFIVWISHILNLDFQDFFLGFAGFVWIWIGPVLKFLGSKQKLVFWISWILFFSFFFVWISPIDPWKSILKNNFDPAQRGFKINF